MRPLTRAFDLEKAIIFTVKLVSLCKQRYPFLEYHKEIVPGDVQWAHEPNAGTATSRVAAGRGVDSERPDRLQVQRSLKDLRGVSGVEAEA